MNSIPILPRIVDTQPLATHAVLEVPHVSLISEVIQIIEAPTIPVDINDPDYDYDDSDEYYDITPAQSVIDEMLIQFIKDKRKISALTEADVLDSAKRIKKFEDLFFNKK